MNIQSVIGLTEPEARKRYLDEGPNELPSERPVTLWHIVFDVLREPMLLMLMAAGALYLFTGSMEDGLMLLGFVFLIIGITVFQKKRTDKAMHALKDLSCPRALVIRDGTQMRIASRDLVQGDWVILSEGDRVPADGVMREGQHLEIDESMLTGESIAIRKSSHDTVATMERPGSENNMFLYSGTLVTQGQATMEVLATGMNTEMGRIGKSLLEATAEPTFLEQETKHMVKRFLWVGMSLSLLFIVIYALTRGGTLQHWKEGLLAGLALAMSVLPEEFPVVLTVFLALGAWRLSKVNVLTRKMNSIETLGAATVLCVDKTGTLTQNKMRVVATTGQETQTLTHAFYACKTQRFDPMELAISEAYKNINPDMHTHMTVHKDMTLLKEYPFSPSTLSVTQVWKTSSGYLVANKGAPENVLQLCQLSEEERIVVFKNLHAYSSEGFRVLGVAHALSFEPPPDPLPQDFVMRWSGLIAFEDPLRASVPSAMQECHQAGMRVVMITGDHPSTAISIAKKAGIVSPEQVLTGSQIETTTLQELQAHAKIASVFARITPEQKLRIINAFKANGDVVAMTGDGVNDAPALTAAHIGIAMGSRGTDVAREAASLVLLDDDFGSIVSAVKLGRRIVDNIKKAISFIIAVHLPIVGLSLLPMFFPNMPLLLLPIHIVFLELIIDPSCTLVFEGEAAEANIMHRPPRSRTEHLFDTHTVWASIRQGLFVLFLSCSVFVATQFVLPFPTVRAWTYATLVLGLLGLILWNRSKSHRLDRMFLRPSRPMVGVFAFVFVYLALALFTPWGQRLFHFNERRSNPAPLNPPSMLALRG